MDATQTYNYFLDFGTSSYLYKTSSTWTYVNKLGTFTRGSSLAISSSYLWVGGAYIYQVSLSSFTIVSTSTNSANWVAVYYNPTTANLFTIEYNTNFIVQYSQDVQTAINSYSFGSSNGKPFSLNGYNNVMYVGTLTSKLYSLSNTGTFTLLGTGCNGAATGIYAMTFDNAGNMLQTCGGANAIYVYNGASYTTYANIQLTVANLYFAGYDQNNHLIVMTLSSSLYTYY